MGALLLDLLDLVANNKSLLLKLIHLPGEVVDLDPPVFDSGVTGLTAVVIQLTLNELGVGGSDVALGDFDLTSNLILEAIDQNGPLFGKLANKTLSRFISALNAGGADIEELVKIFGGFSPDSCSVSFEEGHASDSVEPAGGVKLSLSNFTDFNSEVTFTIIIVGAVAFI